MQMTIIHRQSKNLDQIQMMMIAGVTIWEFRYDNFGFITQEKINPYFLFVKMVLTSRAYPVGLG